MPNTNSSITLQDTLNSDAISMDNVLAYAIANKFNGLAGFNELCSSETRVTIFSFTKGFSDKEVVDFYHAYKPSLLKHLRYHSRENGYSCGFDWAESGMQSKGHDRDETARAMYEGLIKDSEPSAAHFDIATIIVHLAVDALIDAHQDNILSMEA